MADTQLRSPPRRGTAAALLAAARPAQWPKNLLVLSAPAAAGSVLDRDLLAPLLSTLVAFVLASAAVYLVNDTADRHVDATNPRTADRPLARGDVGPGTALATAGVLGVVALALLVTTTSWGAVAVVTAYLAINVGYSLGLKRVPLVELLIVASGYVLRATIGGLATGVPLSAWFLAVASFGALYVVVVKRVSERTAVGHRAVMDEYPDGLLEQVRSLALTATALTYSLWAFETGARRGSAYALLELSVVPFLLGLLRYALVTMRDGGASPEKVVAGDRTLQVVGLVWLAVLAVAINA